MLTIKDIETGNYSQNDVADLMMRLQIASSSLNICATELNKLDESVLENDFIREAYNTALTAWTKLDNDHDCEIELYDHDRYTCKCHLHFDKPLNINE